MIGTFDVRVNAAKPNFPLATFYAFLNSPSHVRVINVPRSIGNWEITKVFVTANYPDNTSRSVECTLTAGCWHGTLPASAATGSSLNGFSVTANGVSEDGTTAVTGYVLGKGDVEILDTDGTITPGETTFYIHILDAQPETPHKGDAFVDAGSWKVYNGSSWVTLGGAFGAAQYVQYPTTEGGDGKWHRVIISEGAIAYDENGVDEPPTCATQTWVNEQIATETSARTAAVSAEAAARQSGDQTNADAISAEATARASAVSAEATAREAADEAEVTARNAAIASAVAAETSARTAAISAEATARAAADAAEVTNRNAAIASAIESEVTNRNAAISSAVSAEATARDSAISTAVAAEAALRQSGDTTNADAISEEAAARQEADSAEVTNRNAAIASAIATEVSDRNAAISAETTARQNADAAEVTNRNTAIAQAVAVEEARATAAENALEEDIDDEVTRATAAESTEAAARAAADTTNANAISAEATARAAADEAEVTARNAAISAHASRTDNPHAVTKAQVGLGNCDNTSDANKPVSTAQESAISSAIATEVTNRNAAIASAVDVSTSGNNLVHKSGAETISGSKTLSSHLNFKTSGTISEAAQNIEIYGSDSSGKVMSAVHFGSSTAGNPLIRIRAYSALDQTFSEICATASTLEYSGSYVKGSAFAAAGMPSSFVEHVSSVTWSLNSTSMAIATDYITAQYSGYVFIGNNYSQSSKVVQINASAEQYGGIPYWYVPPCTGVYNAFVFPILKGHAFKLTVGFSEAQSSTALSSGIKCIRIYRCQAEV